MNTSLSIFARALASENISFSFDTKAETAAFDVKGRHLTMPVWKVSETVQTMLVAHEISHALWTPYEQSLDLFKQAEADGFNIDLLQRICNVIEDARIEKKMKDKFPGTRRDFFLGYQEIYEADLFKMKGVDWSDKNIVAKLNTHFKWGIPGFVEVPFTNGEEAIRDAVDACETFDEVFTLAKFIYEHPSMDGVREDYEQGKMEKKPGKDGSQPGHEFMDTNVEGDCKKNGNTSYSPTIVIPELENVKDVIISTDDMLGWFDKHGEHMPALEMESYRNFVRESDAFVRQLVMQFERRKAADEIRKERPKQTGQLNLDRLHQYRTHDDIFLSKIVKQDGKNHGIVFLIDFSGSMGHTIGDCFLQVLQLVWFCEKAKIPFEVFGFTDIHPSMLPGMEKDYEEWRKKNPNAWHSDYGKDKHPKIKGGKMNALDHGCARLFTIASSRDSAENREKLLAYFYESKVMGRRALPYSMNGTPTVEAVAYASQFIKEWITANNIQIPTLMVVTDGSPNGVTRHEVPISTSRKEDDQEDNSVYHIGKHGSVTVVNHIVDTIDRMQEKEMTSCLGNEIVGMMLNGLRSKFNARIVGMFVGANKLSEGTFAAFCISQQERAKITSYRTLTETARYKAAAEAYADGCIIVHPDVFHGYDAYFLTKTPKIVKDEDAIVESGTFTKVKNTFIKTMGQRSTSRVFLTRYVDIVAGQPIRKGADAIYSQPVI